MIALALRIIAHRPMRYLVALLGISIAVGLALVQFGLYRGFKENASIVADHTSGDIWVTAEFQDNFDFPNLLDEDQLAKVRATPGVEQVSEMIVTYAPWKLDIGSTKSCQVIGFDARTGVGAPWRMVAGIPEDLQRAASVTVDVSTRHKLANPELGEIAELGGIKVKVVGLTKDIRSFQGHPMVFTDVSTARALRRDIRSDQFHYGIVRVKDGYSKKEVLASLRREGEASRFEAYNRDEFSAKAQNYWLRSTGAGIAMGVFAVMGLVVGVVVAGQVLYTSTMEHIREYGTLKAIGATNLQVTFAIVVQAVTWALPAHLVGGALMMFAGENFAGQGLHLSLSTEYYLKLGFGTVGVCILASMLAVAKVWRVSPADVFK